MRRILAILLLVVFGMPFVQPIFALAGSGSVSDANLPACCRRDGKHHCAMPMGERMAMSRSQDRAFRAPAEKCPCCPASIAPVSHSDLFTAPTAQAIYASLISHPSGIAQTRSRWRIARERSRGKRGPPLVTLS